MAQRRRARHALVHEMLAQGAGFRQIARHLGWNHTVPSLNTLTLRRGKK